MSALSPIGPWYVSLIAGTPSHGTRHVDPDVTGRVLSHHETRDYALHAARRYMREHPEAWVQIHTESEQGEDVAS